MSSWPDLWDIGMNQQCIGGRTVTPHDGHESVKPLLLVLHCWPKPKALNGRYSPSQFLAMYRLGQGTNNFPSGFSQSSQHIFQEAKMVSVKSLLPRFHHCCYITGICSQPCSSCILEEHTSWLVACITLLAWRLFGEQVSLTASSKLINVTRLFSTFRKKNSSRKKLKQIFEKL